MLNTAQKKRETYDKVILQKDNGGEFEKPLTIAWNDLSDF